MRWGTHPTIILMHGEQGREAFAETPMWFIKLSHHTSVHTGHLSPPVSKQKGKSQSLLWTLGPLLGWESVPPLPWGDEGIWIPVGMDRSERSSYWGVGGQKGWDSEHPPSHAPCWVVGTKSWKGPFLPGAMGWRAGKFLCAWPSQVVISWPFLGTKSRRYEWGTQGWAGHGTLRGSHNWAAWRGPSGPGAS